MSRSSVFESHSARALCGLLLLVAVMLCFPVLAHAQAPDERKLVVNQVTTRGWPEVSLNLTLVGSDGKAVPGVTAEQFEVLEDGTNQVITGLELGEARTVPINLVLVLDVSGSMAGQKIDDSKAAAITFLNSLRPQDQFTLLAFSTRVRTVVPATSDRAALEAGINSLQAAGNTAAYDGLYTASQIVAQASPEQRRVIILLTDGADTSSNYGAAVAAEVARQSGALVFTIGLGADAVDSVLTSLAEPSGGRYYKAPTPNDLQGVYSAISVELSSQMLIKYKSTSVLKEAYDLIQLQIRYTGPDGQSVTNSVRYRPPRSSIIPSTPVPRIERPEIVQAGLPPGIAPPASTPVAPAARPVDVAFPILLGISLGGLSLLLVGAGIFSAVRPDSASRRLASYTGPVAPALGDARDDPESFANRVLLPVLESVGTRLARLSPRGYRDNIQNLLLLMGPPYRLHVAAFIAIQLVAAILLSLAFGYWAFVTSPDTPMRWLLTFFLGLVSGIYLPYSFVARKVSKRRKDLLRALPGALDFLAINVEAGMGFDAAMAEVAKRWRNRLTDEFALLLIDFQIGKHRKDAWRDLVQRTQVPDLTSFVTAMVQSEQLGSSIGSLLRTQAEHMRIRRRQRAEEAARVAPVKMLLPMVFFIFPGILVVILGPAIPQFIDTFANLNR